MNRYPLWLYLLIGVIVLGGALFALPNLFGESPAVQISAARPSAKIDDALRARAEDALKQAGVALEASFVDESSVKVRFADTDTQLKAKDVIERALGEDYTVALNLISNSPRWLAAIGAKPMYLGLDLRGGVHFLLQVDMKGAITKSLDSAAAGIRSSCAARTRPAPAASAARASRSWCGSGRAPTGTRPRPSSRATSRTWCCAPRSAAASIC
jgi:preprotein translocase subunit SecD